MKVLCSSVLAIEAIVVFLASLVASTNGSVSSQGLAIGLGSALAVLLIASIGTLRKRWGIYWCWLLQVVVVSGGLLVPLMFVVGGIFAILWFVAVRTGTRVDALQADYRAQQEQQDEQEQPSQDEQSQQP